MPIVKNDETLSTLDEWKKLGGPKSESQWVDGRSAKEAAKAWLAGSGVSLPDEVAKVLAAHPSFGAVTSWTAEPEGKLCFDNFGGEPRNSDLVVHAVDSHGPYLIAVEAKADEPFGETVAATLAAALERYLQNERSNGIARVQQLAQALFGPRQAKEPSVKLIRYQLLTACAAAICEAERRGYTRTLMLVEEFITDKTEDDKHATNAKDLNTFLKRLSHGTVTAIHGGEIVGPFAVPGKPLCEGKADLYVGKVQHQIRGHEAR